MASLRDEYTVIQSEYDAIETECMLMETLESDFSGYDIIDNPFYDYAFESSESNSVAEAKVKNFFAKMWAWIKRIFSFIPKIFVKLGRKIKHSKLITKMRADAGVPKDLKQISDDKLNSIKQIRRQILDVKQKIYDTDDKMIQATMKMSSQLEIEMQAVARIIKVGSKARDEVIKGKLEVSQGKLDSINKQFQRIIEMEEKGESKTLIEKHKELEDKMRKVCEGDERLFALAMPVYKGTDRTSDYITQITTNCDKHVQLADALDAAIKADKELYDTILLTLGPRFLKITVPINIKYIDISPLTPPASERGRQLKASRETKERVSKAAAAGAAGVFELVNLYRVISNYISKVTIAYAEHMNLVFKSYPLPQAPDSGETNKSMGDASVMGKKIPASKLKGYFSFDKSQGFWTYTEECLDKNNNKHTFVFDLKGETNENKKKSEFTISRDDLKKLENEKGNWARSAKINLKDLSCTKPDE